jgi:hypothetical protein
MSHARAIRTASVLSCVVGLGTLLTLGPSLASDLLTDRSSGSPLGLNPSYGNFTVPNPLGLPVVVVIIFGVASSSRLPWRLWRPLQHRCDGAVSRVSVASGTGM